MRLCGKSAICGKGAENGQKSKKVADVGVGRAKQVRGLQTIKRKGKTDEATDEKIKSFATFLKKGGAKNFENGQTETAFTAAAGSLNCISLFGTTCLAGGFRKPKIQSAQ